MFLTVVVFLTDIAEVELLVKPVWQVGGYSVIVISVASRYCEQPAAMNSALARQRIVRDSLVRSNEDRV